MPPINATKTPIAQIVPFGTPAFAFVIIIKPIVVVCIFVPFVINKDGIYQLNVPDKVLTVKVVNTGQISGTTMLKNCLISDAPSKAALSNNSPGIRPIAEVKYII